MTAPNIDLDELLAGIWQFVREFVAEELAKVRTETRDQQHAMETRLLAALRNEVHQSETRMLTLIRNGADPPVTVTPRAAVLDMTKRRAPGK